MHLFLSLLCCTFTLCVEATFKFPARFGIDDELLTHDGPSQKESTGVIQKDLDRGNVYHTNTQGNTVDTIDDSQFALPFEPVSREQDLIPFKAAHYHDVIYHGFCDTYHVQASDEKAPYRLQFVEPPDDDYTSHPYTDAHHSEVDSSGRIIEPKRSSPQAREERIRVSPYQPISDVIWFAGKLPSKEHKLVISNLSKYWNLPKRATWLRLKDYISRYGLVTSPEPLLNYDTPQFAEAASLIYDERRGRRRPLARPNLLVGGSDILHRSSTHYGTVEGPPIFINYADRPIKHNAHFYHSHKWHQDMEPEAIKVIHSAIVHHWVPWLDRKHLSSRLRTVNTYLEEHPDVLEQIKGGDTEAAYDVAFVCIGCKEDKMRRFHLLDDAKRLLAV